MINTTTTETQYTHTPDAALPSNIICFSPIRWEHGFQRPQQMMSGLSDQFNIFFIEEPVYDAFTGSFLTHHRKSAHIDVIVPHLPSGIREEKSNQLQQKLLDDFMQAKNFTDYAFWYNTPAAFSYSNHYRPSVTVYDCMEEPFKLSAEKFSAMEQQLLGRADIVFTSCHSIYMAKKDKHQNVHLLPGSIDKDHFDKARGKVSEAEDQEAIPFPRIGYMGAIDNRLDIELLQQIADARPDWHIVLVGSSARMNASMLPQRPNIHYLGNKPYSELPSYLTGWTASIMPISENTRLQSHTSTKAAECIAAGVPVIATPVKEITEQYGENKLILTATNAEEFITATEAVLFNGVADRAWLNRVNDYLELNSWNNTLAGMLEKIKDTVHHTAYINQVA